MEKRLSAALVVSMIALFVALGGTAGAVVTAAVPLAKLGALVADNAKSRRSDCGADRGAGSKGCCDAVSRGGSRGEHGGGARDTKTQVSAQLGAGAGQAFQLVCDTGQKVLSGGFVADNAVIIAVANAPVSDTTWGIGLLNLDSSAPANVNLYAICLK